jgi:peptidoglycan hydrolase-like protein with peptidoglycan-binding domain
MVLRRGDRGERVKALQRRVNRLGSLLLVDGDFGVSTEAAVVDARAALELPPSPLADDRLQRVLAAVPEPSAELTTAGVVFIGREEISSPAAYRRRYSRPVWPTENSGITIGIGYDLAFVDRAKLEADWGGVLPSDVLDRLAEVSGTKGSAARRRRVEDVVVPLLGAVRVFLRRMLPEHVGKARRIYPRLDLLPPNRRTALISLVFNRGADLEGPRRREMKRIAQLLVAGELEPIADEIVSMTRLWSPATEAGVIARRQREAILWREGFEALHLA